MNVKRILSITVILTVLLGILFSVPAYADQKGTPGEKLNMSGTARVTSKAQLWSAPGTTGHTYNGIATKKLGDVSENTVVTFDYLENDGDGDTWYHIVSGTTEPGFICTTRLAIITVTTTPTYVYEENFEKQLLYFPIGYRDHLRQLHAKYPNFRFEPLYVGKTLDSCVDMQYSSTDCTKTKKYISVTTTNTSYIDQRAKKQDGTYIQPEPGWTYASRVCIYNFMNPQNLLGEERIFTMLNLSKSNETVNGLKAVVNGTFLAKGYEEKPNAYIEDIMEAANQSGVSAYAIAALIIVEQGTNGTSPIISGTYTSPIDKVNYSGYYNFFNYGAYGSSKDAIYTNGLAKAKSEGWNSRRAAIVGGAKLFAKNYIQKGQNSYYLMNFDLANANHQYAANVQDSVTKSKRLYSAFKNNTAVSLNFNIPVYSEFYQNPFPDVDMGQWYTDAIKFVKEKGIFKGFSDGMFRPNANISRQDFVVALARLSGEDLTPYATQSVKLKDVKSSEYYYSSIAWAYKKGVIKGYDNGCFGIGDKITREQVLTILYRYVKDYLHKQINLPVTPDFITDGYTDYKSVSAYAKDAVVWALIVGAISGKSNGTVIAPKDFCTRAEMAAIFCNCMENEIITTN